MALGDTNNYGNGSDNKNKLFDPTFFSRIRIKNKDKLAVGFSYNKGLLRATVSEERNNFNYEELISINISPTKAKLLLFELNGFIDRLQSGEAIDPNEGVGINTGVSDTVTFIAFKTTGNRTDVPEHSFIIGKVDSNGNVTNTVEFVFNVDYDYSLHWNNVVDMDVRKNIDQFMGVKLFRDVLAEFDRSSAGAIGASVWDTGRYEYNRILRKMDPIYDKLGIERQSRNNGNSENFFSRQSSSPMNPPQQPRSNSRSYDEIENLISGDD